MLLTPGFATSNLRYGGDADAILLRKGAMIERRWGFSYFTSLRHRQFCKPAPPSVFGSCNWFQVVRVATRRLATKVVNSHPIGDRANHLLVHPPMSRGEVTTDHCAMVSPSCGSAVWYPAWCAKPSVLVPNVQWGRKLMSLAEPEVLPSPDASVLVTPFRNGRDGSAPALAQTRWIRPFRRILDCAHRMTSYIGRLVGHDRGRYRAARFFCCPNYTASAVVKG